MADIHAFSPVGGATVNLAVTTATGNVQIQSGHNNRHMRIWNSGAVTVFVEQGGDNTVTASTSTSMPIPAGNTEVFSAPYQYLAAITASGTATIYITPGEGI